MKELEEIVARTPFVMHQETFRVERILINNTIALDFCAQKSPLIFLFKTLFKQHVPLFCIVNCRE